MKIIDRRDNNPVINIENNDWALIESIWLTFKKYMVL